MTVSVQPNKAIWERVNAAIVGENLGEVITTLNSGLCALLVDAGACATENEARVQLAAILLSPNNSPKVGSLFPLLEAALEKLRLG